MVAVLVVLEPPPLFYLINFNIVIKLATFLKLYCDTQMFNLPVQDTFSLEVKVSKNIFIVALLTLAKIVVDGLFNKVR